MKLCLKKLNFQLMSYASLFLFGACSTASYQRQPIIKPYLAKSVVIFHAFPLEPLPPKIIQPLLKQQEEQIAKMKIFKTVISYEKGQQQIAIKPQLRQELEMYLETFTLTNISNIDISRRVAKELNVEQFLIIHYELFPCTKCDSNNSIWISFQLINAHDAKVIWRGTWGKNLDNDEFENLLQTARSMSNEILQSMPRYLKEPWHRKRYLQLKQLTQLQ